MSKLYDILEQIVEKVNKSVKFEEGQIHTNRKQIDYVAVPEELRLGCYRSNTGGTGRFAKGIMNDCKVYNYALSDEEIQNLIGS